MKTLLFSLLVAVGVCFAQTRTIAIMPVEMSANLTLPEGMDPEALRQQVYNSIASHLVTKKQYPVADKSAVEQAIRTQSFGGLSQRVDGALAMQAAQSVYAPLALICTVGQASPSSPMTVDILILDVSTKLEAFRGHDAASTRQGLEAGLTDAVETALKKLVTNR